MKNVVYKVSSTKEATELEKAYEKFSEFYKLEIDYGNVEVSKLTSQNLISFYPIEKNAVIKNISINNGQLEGKLLKSSPEFCLIDIEGTRFDINFKPRE
jgi:hypothetical protein